MDDLTLQICVTVTLFLVALLMIVLAQLQENRAHARVMNAMIEINRQSNDDFLKHMTRMQQLKRLKHRRINNDYGQYDINVIK